MNFVKGSWAGLLAGGARNSHGQGRGASRGSRSRGGGPIIWQVLKPIAVYVGTVSLLSMGWFGAL